MTKILPDLLKEVNENVALLKEKAYRENNLLRFIFAYAYDPDMKFVLPDGVPPYRSAPEPIGMTPTTILFELKKMYVFTKQRELKPLIREKLFIQLLEGLHPSEAELILLIKEQKLQSKYPNITKKVVELNGFIPTPAEKETGKKLAVNVKPNAAVPIDAIKVPVADLKDKTLSKPTSTYKPVGKMTPEQRKEANERRVAKMKAGQDKKKAAKLAKEKEKETANAI